MFSNFISNLPTYFIVIFLPNTLYIYIYRLIIKKLGLALHCKYL